MQLNRLRTPTMRRALIFALRLFAIGIVTGFLVWLVTGDIDKPWLTLHVTGGWKGVIVGVAAAALALIGAQLLERGRGPAA